MLGFLTLLVSYLYLAIVNASAKGLEEEHVLVLFDPEIIALNDSSANLTPEVTHFMQHLNSKYKTFVGDYNDVDISLFSQDYPKFDHLVLFPTSKKSIKNSANLNQHQLLKFFNAGGNIFAIGGSDVTTTEGINSFLNELGIYPSPKSYRYIDHFNTEKDGVVELKQEENLVQENRILKSLKTVEYKGNAALISNSELIQPIVKSSKTGYTNKVGETMNGKNTWTFGEQGYLAVGFQALNNARLVWIGSESLLADDALFKWCFQETGVIKLQFVQHMKADEPEKINPHLYKIKDEAIYTIGVSELVDGKWVPFEVTEEEDQFQLSFKMLDPYQRLNLKPLGPVSTSSENKSALDAYAYHISFTVPDHHGMFTFELDYKRHGLSYILDKKVVTVRHLANDEFKRSWDISNSWLYLASTALKNTLFKNDRARGDTDLEEGLESTSTSTILKSKRILPTVGQNTTTIKFEASDKNSPFAAQFNNINLKFWDLGGQRSLRNMWSRYFKQCHGIIFVIDSTDTARFQECYETLIDIANHDSWLVDNSEGQEIDQERTIGIDGTVNVPILMLANKQDLPQAVDLVSLKTGVFIKLVSELEATDSKLLPVSVLENQGLKESLEWLVTRLIYNKGNKRPEYK
ncbi:WBP1 [Candida oxycetoniae]|uniref:Dolichyl-diphosphooligosaccharide--protein glycosyltransferase subunit WBP1 n=1 Tax=Candida oxycetoniae TaxID=497107 RepID=A0AAI9WYK2_9ASCO|nr:WBP1 [Candida oxycetoniae]KAI3405392.2 WBP1 [Candida oxycetoniae]